MVSMANNEVGRRYNVKTLLVDKLIDGDEGDFLEYTTLNRYIMSDLLLHCKRKKLISNYV